MKVISTVCAVCDPNRVFYDDVGRAAQESFEEKSEIGVFCRKCSRAIVMNEWNFQKVDGVVLATEEERA